MYIGTLTIYIYNTFLIGTYGDATTPLFTYLMVIGIFYPFVYDSAQLYKQGWEYF